MSSYAQYYNGNGGGSSGVGNQQSFLSNNAYKPQRPNDGQQRIDQGGLFPGGGTAGPTTPYQQPGRVFSQQTISPQVGLPGAQMAGQMYRQRAGGGAPPRLGQSEMSNPEFLKWRKKLPWAQQNTGDMYGQYQQWMQSQQQPSYQLLGAF